MAQLLCVWCAKTEQFHEAYFMVGGESLCIRHGAEAVFPHGNQDMEAHDMAHAVYQRLNEAGVRNAY